MILMEGAIRITVRICSSTRSAVSICSGASRSCRAIKCRMTELIIHFLLFRIAEDIVSFCCFLEFLFCLWIVFVRIRMISLRQLTISFLNRILIGRPIYTKDIVIIPLRWHVSPSHLYIYLMMPGSKSLTPQAPYILLLCYCIWIPRRFGCLRGIWYLHLQFYNYSMVI